MALTPKLYINKIKPNLWANKNFTIFFYNFFKDKKRYRGLIDLRDKVGWFKRDKISIAEAELIHIKNKKIDNMFDDSITLDSFAIKHFEMSTKSNWEKVKISHYNRYIKRSIGKKRLFQIKPLHIKEVIKQQENLGLSIRTTKLTIEVLSPIFNEAIENRIISYNPAAAVKIKRPLTRKIVTNATKELAKINNAINIEFGEDLFYKALFTFAMQGRRKSEILSLKWEDVDFDNNIYILRNTKNNEEQKIFLPENIKQLLIQFQNSNQEYVFTSRITGKNIQNIKHSLAKMKIRLNNPSFGLNYLRNVIVSAMAERGLESMYLSGALGHRDTHTIKKYLTLNYLQSSKKASEVISEVINPDTSK